MLCSSACIAGRVDGVIVWINRQIFRRADKNDDGKLSLEEFQSYFTDGILTDEQMQELYYSIDRQQTDNLDIDTLSEYFTPYLGEYVNVLSALEKLNVAILKAMDKTKEVGDDDFLHRADCYLFPEHFSASFIPVSIQAAYFVFTSSVSLKAQRSCSTEKTTLASMRVF
uniref:EF-hand domain-containing protein n=1 Tax=Mastacembelus armatus TaxID=205130 RepID=A0A3Q3MKM2_9TELE